MSTQTNANDGKTAPALAVQPLVESHDPALNSSNEQPPIPETAVESQIAVADRQGEIATKEQAANVANSEAADSLTQLRAQMERYPAPAQPTVVAPLPTAVPVPESSAVQSVSDLSTTVVSGPAGEQSVPAPEPQVQPSVGPAAEAIKVTEQPSGQKMSVAPAAEVIVQTGQSEQEAMNAKVDALAAQGVVDSSTTPDQMIAAMKPIPTETAVVTPVAATLPSTDRPVSVEPSTPNESQTVVGENAATVEGHLAKQATANANSTSEPVGPVIGQPAKKQSVFGQIVGFFSR